MRDYQVGDELLRLNNEAGEKNKKNIIFKKFQSIFYYFGYFSFYRENIKIRAISNFPVFYIRF